MAKGPASAELQGNTQIEFTRPQRPPEKKADARDSLGVSGALGALREDKPDVSDRKDLINLVGASRRTYRRFDKIAQVREVRLKDPNRVNFPRPESVVGAAESTAKPQSETDKIYSEPFFDPLIRQTEDNISSRTNLAPEVQAALASKDPNINQVWFGTHGRISAQAWSEFVDKYPDKATRYAGKYPSLKIAIEARQRQEQARVETQAENDQLLADSVRRETNDVSENMVSEELAASESGHNRAEVTEPNETGPETKLLSTETAGVQATLLLGGEIGAEIDKAKIEAIAKGGPINAERANKASLGEREDYWNGENSPYKNMTFEQQLEKWRGTMQTFFDQYKGKPEAEFFKRVGIDLENENAVREIYQTYFVDGEGDLGLFSQKIAQNNSAEQIQENRVIIERLGKMYGEKSAKVMVEMTMGVKNAQTDIDSFMQSAQAAIDKGEDMPGIDLINFLSAKKEGQDDAESAQTASAERDAINSSDKAGTENASEVIAADVNNNQEFKLNRNERASSADTWSGDGDLKIEGDVLAFTPHVNGLRNPYSSGTTEYDYFEKYQVRYFQPDNPSDFFIGEQRKRVERGVDLAVDSKTGKVPSSMFWKIIEADPESVSGGRLDWYVTLDTQSDSVKSVRPIDLKIRNNEGTPRTVDVNFSWRGLKVDRQALVGMQQKAVEYLKQQVDVGIMPAETLETAKSLVSRFKAPRTVSHPREIPLVSKLQSPEKWRGDGSLVVNGRDIVYTDATLNKYNDSRSVEIFTTDPNNLSKRILTAQAWDVLNAATHSVDGNRPVTDALTREVMKRGGEFYRPVVTFTADRPMVSKMKDLIRDNVAREIQEGAMDESVLSDIDNVLNYRSPAQNVETEEALAV